MYGTAGRTADRFAAEVLRQLGVPLQPPVDLRLVAERLKVSRIEYRELLEDGRVDREGQTVVITIRSDAPHQRQRFTLAHELAHVILDSGEVDSFSARRSKEQFSVEETLCDALAGGLLMPREWVDARYENAGVGMGAMFDLARLADVSLSAALVRLREVCGWQASLLHWRRSANGRWRLEEAAGAFPSQRSAVGASEGTHWALEALSAHPTKSIVKTDLPLRFAAQEIDVQAQLTIRRATALALVTLPDPGPPTLAKASSASSSRPSKDHERRT